MENLNDLTPTEQEAYDERVAIMIIDAHLPEWQAEKEAMEGILKNRKNRVSDHPMKSPTLPVDDDFNVKTVHCMDIGGKIE